MIHVWAHWKHFLGIYYGVNSGSRRQEAQPGRPTLSGGWVLVRESAQQMPWWAWARAETAVEGS